MSALNATTLLRAWEVGEAQPPLRRALTLLACAWPETSCEQWSEASIGERDSRLLSLREELFGSRIEAVAVCPACRERLEVAFSTRDIRAPQPTKQGRLQVSAAGYRVICRLPTSADLLSLPATRDENLQRRLLDRCIEEVRFDGQKTDSGMLPQQVVEAIETEIARADPQADVQVALSCTQCGHGWHMTFDVLAYLWNEIDDWAQRQLYEIHVLASAYGWVEHEILRLSARRRRLYLEMIGV